MQNIVDKRQGIAYNTLNNKNNTAFLKEENMKYVLYIDYCAGAKKEIEYRDLLAKNIEEAIEEAEKEILKAGIFGEIYLARIMKRYDFCVDKELGVREEYFAAIMCKRKIWRRNIPENGENEQRVRRSEYKKGLCKGLHCYTTI